MCDTCTGPCPQCRNRRPVDSDNTCDACKSVLCYECDTFNVSDIDTCISCIRIAFEGYQAHQHED